MGCSWSSCCCCCCCCAPPPSDPKGCPGDDAALRPETVLFPPGRCAFGQEWGPAVLRERFWATHDTMVLTFGLSYEAKPLGLSTCACIVARHVPEASGPIVRPYTPISTNAMVGAFQLLVKVYEEGAMSQHLSSMPLGDKLEFRHGPENIKVQYPFRAKHLTMLAGGAGITPMIQALHAVLGSPGDATRVSLIFSNRQDQDIIGREKLDAWAGLHPERFQVVYVLTRAGDDEWSGERGHIHAGLIKKHAPPPSDDALIMVCGPPAMYASLCGPRGEEEVAGVLRDLGYGREHVVKF